MKAFLLALALTCAAAAQFPQAEISNAHIHAKLYLPDAQAGYYRATRFDWAGQIASLEWNGHNYFGQWFDKYDPKLHDAIMGPVEEFLPPVGYDEAKTGNSFVKVGVGAIRRPEESEFHQFNTYEIADAGKRSVKSGKDWIEFTQELNDTNGYAYVYRKKLQLSGDKLVLEHHLKNTGHKDIATAVYEHNFFMLDGTPTGPDISIRFPFTVQAGGITNGLAEVHGSEFQYLQELKRGETVYTPLTGFGGDVKDYDIRVENHRTGAGVRQTSDRPIAKMVLWSIRSNVSPEAYIDLKIAPGKEESWNISYDFYAIPPAESVMYVGTYTKGASKGIYAYRFNSGTGKATPIGLVAESANPSFLALSPDGRFLYAVNEKAEGEVSAYAIDPATAQLKFLNKVATRGADPCHLAVDQSGKWLYVANYTGGSSAAFPVRPDGSLGEAVTFNQNTGSSVVKSRQSEPHAHETVLSPDNRFVFVVDLGLDEILSYRVDASKGMVPNTPPFAKTPPGAGPRHFVFSRDTKFVYDINEIASTVTVFQYDAAAGSMKEVQTISTLPAGFTGQSSTAEIMLHPSGRFLYASNRGHDSIAIFRVDTATGKLTALDRVSTQGKTPRNFAIDPSGSFLLAANQDTGNIVIFKINSSTGALTPTGDVLQTPYPVSILFSGRTSPRQ